MSLFIKLDDQNMISYRLLPSGKTSVILEKKKVGDIVSVDGGFQYRPKESSSKFWGKVFVKMSEVKNSIEND